MLPFADIDALVVVVEGGVEEVSLLIEKLLLMWPGLDDEATTDGTNGSGGRGPPAMGGKYGLCRPAYGEYNGKFEYKLETGGGTSTPLRWLYGSVGIGGGGGPVLVPISTLPTPFGTLFNSPKGPPNIGGIPPGIDVTGFSPFPLINGDAADE